MQTIVALAIVALASAADPATQNKNNWVAEANAFSAEFAMGDTTAFSAPQTGLIASSSAVNQKTGSNLRFWKANSSVTMAVAVAGNMEIENAATAPATATAIARTASTTQYERMKELEQLLHFTKVQETYVKDEMRNLKRELIRAQEEVKRIKSVPLLIGQFLEMIDDKYALVSSTSGSTYYARVLSTLDRELLKTNASVALHKLSHSLVDTLPPEADSRIQMMTEKPDVTYDVRILLELTYAQLIPFLSAI